jgi:hypothetical protein
MRSFTLLFAALLVGCGGDDGASEPGTDTGGGGSDGGRDSSGDSSVVVDGDASGTDTAIPGSDTAPGDGTIVPPSKTFFATPQPAGEITVTLHPTEGIAAGATQLVTFGVPFPRGSIKSADVAKIRVLDEAGGELAAHVEALTPWRKVGDATVDSIRVVRIQLSYVTKTAYPAGSPIKVVWGGAARTKDVAALTGPRTGWHLVTSGSFVAADGVYEPNVYAVLPAAWLSLGAIKPMQMDAFDAKVSPTRDDPATMKATEHYPDFLEQQYGMKNFFYTAINEDDPAVTTANRAAYKTDSEPWLYDRAATFFGLYLRSGSFKALRESVRAAAFYAKQLYPAGTTPDAAIGAFKLKNPSPSGYIGANGVMYSYNECLAYEHWLTGDPDVIEPIKWASKAQEDANDEAYRWSPTLGYTERHVGFRGLAHVVAYEMFGAVPYKAGGKTYEQLLTAFADNLIWHQDGAGGAIPAARVDGALWKYGRQQGDGPEGEFVASAWLTAIHLDAMVHLYAVTERADVASFIRRTGTFLMAATDLVDDDEYDAPVKLRKVDYVTLIDGSTVTADGATGEHALEVASSLGWAYAFSVLTGKPDTKLRDHAKEVYLTWDHAVTYWTRPAAPASGLTAYRLSVGVFRKYSWEHRPATSLSWSMGL